MPKINVIQNSFQSGAISKAMYGRSDTNEYQQGAKTIANFIVRPTGGLTRRSGSVFMGETKNDEQTRLIPFPIGDRFFLIEMGDLFMRVWEETDGSLALVPTEQDYIFPDASLSVWDTPSANGWNFLMHRKDMPLGTGMGPYAISTTGDLSATGLEAQSPDLYLHVTTQPRSAATPAHPHDYDANVTPIEIRFFSSHLAATHSDGSTGLISLGTSNGTGIHTLTTQNAGYLTTTHTAEGDKIRWARSDAELWIMSTETSSPFATQIYKIRYFEKLDSFAYEDHADVGQGHIEVDWRNGENEGPFHTISNTSAFDENLEWNEVSANPLTTMFEVFTMTQTNRGHGGTWETDVHWANPGIDAFPFRYGLVYGREREGGSADTAGEADNWGVGKIYDGSTVDGSMVRPFTRAATRIDTDLYAFGPMFTDTEAWRSLALFQGRMCLAGGIKPGTVSFGSLEKTLLFIPADIDGAVTDATAFQLDIREDQDLRIESMIATQRKLFVVTRQAVYAIAPVGITFSVTSFNITPVNRIPGMDAQGVSFGDFAAYITADGLRVMAVDVNNEGIKYNTFDLTRFADHILEPAADTITHQRTLGSLLWLRKTDGTLASITFDREAGVIAPATHTIAGDTVTVEDAVAMPISDGTDGLYLSVNRTVDGVVRRYIERIPAIPKQTTPKRDYVLLDCAGTYTGASVTQVPVNTFDHLEGETAVDVYAQGEYIGTRGIVSGRFDVVLDDAAATIHVGYKYNSDVDLLRPTESFPAFGTTEGSLKRNIAAVIQLSNAQGGKIGPDADDLQPIEYDQTSKFTGELEVPIDDDSKRDARLFVRADTPEPLDITAVIRRVDFESRGGQ